MRIIETKVFTFDEHPNPQSCFDWIRSNWHDLGQHYVDDMIESLKALAKTVQGDLDYSLSIAPDRGEFVSIKGYDAALLAGLYALKDDCPLTGMCYDIDVIEALRRGDLQSTVLNILHNEGEYIYSDDGLREFCAGNEYEFDESGEAV